MARTDVPPLSLSELHLQNPMLVEVFCLHSLSLTLKEKMTMANGTRKYGQPLDTASALLCCPPKNFIAGFMLHSGLVKLASSLLQQLRYYRTRCPANTKTKSLRYDEMLWEVFLLFTAQFRY
jgi:hypothetical protein